MSTTTIRTQDEILARIEEIKRRDFLGFETDDLIGYLDFEHAKPFLKPETTPDQWQPDSTDPDEIKAQMLDYMPFAWEKANNFRGISASRSMSHYSAWMWMTGDLEKVGDLHDYEYYGKDNLAAICELYGWDSGQWDDGVRANSEE